MDWSQATLQPDFLMGVFWGFYRTPEARRNLPRIKTKIDACAAHFRLLDRILADRPFLAGDRLTLADVVAAIQAFERARAIPPVPPRSIREALTSTPLAPTTATAPRTPMSSALSTARAISARASSSAISRVCI